GGGAESGAHRGRPRVSTVDGVAPDRLETRVALVLGGRAAVAAGADSGYRLQPRRPRAAPPGGHLERVRDPAPRTAKPHDLLTLQSPGSRFPAPDRRCSLLPTPTSRRFSETSPRSCDSDRRRSPPGRHRPATRSGTPPSCRTRS